MSKTTKSNGSKKTATTTTVVEKAPVMQPQVSAENAGEKKKLGRPVVPNSTRQIEMAKKQALRDAGLLKRGRKANPESKRQERLAILEEKRKAGLLTGKRGRPTIPDSPHQQKIAEKQARIDANGGVPMKPGRPPYTAEQKAAAAAIKAEKIAALKAAKASAVTAA